MQLDGEPWPQAIPGGDTKQPVMVCLLIQHALWGWCQSCTKHSIDALKQSVVTLLR